MDFLAGRADDRLDFIAVNQSSDVRVRDLGSWKDVILLVSRSLLKCAKDFVEESKGSLCPNNKTAKMTTRGKLKKVQSPDIDKFRNLPGVLVIYDQGTPALTMSTIPEFALPSTDFAGVRHLKNICIRVK